MNKKNYVNFHILFSHSPSCLNRDDMNMQKMAIFGGCNRVRISSQSQKYWMRKSEYYKSHFPPSVRTRFLFDRSVAELLSGAKSESEREGLEKAALYMAAVFEGKKKPDEIKKYKRADSGQIATQVIPFHLKEIEEIKKLIQKASQMEDEKRLEFISKNVAAMQKKMAGEISLDVALSGRMANSDTLYGIDGAMALAHAITTHAVEPQDLDWFTAVDDLVEDSGESGAGHLNTQQFSSGVFYRYASLNLKQLQVNLGSVTDMSKQETAASRKEALEIARHVFHMLMTVVPSAKQQSFAAYNLADFVLVNFADQPVSLANAFETPIKAKNGSGFLWPSVQGIIDYWGKITRAYGLEERAASFSLVDPISDQPKKDFWPDELKLFKTIDKMKGWIAKDGTV